MLNISRNSNTTIYFTGTEQAALTNPFWLIVFSKSGTEAKAVYTDISTHKSRYNKVVINSSIFANLDDGIWSYDIYEQASSSGTSTAGKNKVESGFMTLRGAAFNPTEYTGQSTQVITYGT
jgi:hypothetical protein